VDDIIVAAQQLSTVESVISLLGSIFDIRNLGEPQHFLGMELQRDQAKGTIKLSNQRAIINLAQQYGMQHCKPLSTPFPAGTHLTADSDGAPSPVGYSNLVGSLLYLSITTRPDISQAVGVLARYMSQPTATHFNAAKSVLRYLISTADTGIVYSSTGGDLHGFTDADHAGDLDTRRSTTGYCFINAGGIISWSSRLQQTVAVSTAEAEYMAAAAATKEGLWILQLWKDLGLETPVPLKIYSDNQAALSLLRNPVSSQRSKHIDVMYHFARERVAMGDVVFHYCTTHEQVADALTKPVPAPKLRTCTTAWGMA
jgi:hypothetical protein